MEIPSPSDHPAIPNYSISRNTYYCAKIAYHSTKVESNSCKVERHHSKEIKELPQPVYISTKNLFTITTSNLPLE